MANDIIPLQFRQSRLNHLPCGNGGAAAIVNSATNLSSSGACFGLTEFPWLNFGFHQNGAVWCLVSLDILTTFQSVTHQLTWLKCYDPLLSPYYLQSMTFNYLNVISYYDLRTFSHEITILIDFTFVESCHRYNKTI